MIRKGLCGMKAKQLFAQIAASLLGIVMLVGCSACASPSAQVTEPSSESSSETASQSGGSFNDGASSEDMSAELKSLPEKFPELNTSNLQSVYSFTLDGKSYELPVAVSDLLANGWSETPDVANTFYHAVPESAVNGNEAARFSLWKDGKGIEVVAVSGTSDPWEWQDDYVVEIKGGSDKLDASVVPGNGLGIGSSLEEVLDVHGKPYDFSFTTKDGAEYVSQVVYSAANAGEKQPQTFNSIVENKDQLIYSFDDQGNVKQFNMTYYFL